MKKEFLKELTDAGKVKLNFIKKDGSLRNMVCTTAVEHLKENRDVTGWKEDAEIKESPETVLPVWDLENEGWRNVPLDSVLFVMSNNMDIKYKKFVQIVRELDDSKFTPLKAKKISNLTEKHIKHLHENLWSMFKTKFNGEDLQEMRKKDPMAEPFGACVADYGWTDEVRDAFYEHPSNKPIVTAMKKMEGMTWGMWALDAEVCEIDHFTGNPLIETES